MSEKRTELSELGEFGLIDHLTKGIAAHQGNTIKGIGDDAAVIDAGEDFLLVSTDMLMEGVHFDLSYTPLKHLGYKSVVVNLSDIYAMNGRPEQVTISLAVSNRFSVEALEELYEGIRLAAQIYDVDIVGGDTTTSIAGLAISVTAIGRVNKEKVVYRSGAKDKELLVVSGNLGASYMGLQILEREKAVFEAAPGAQPDLSGNDYILERHLKPEARKDIIDMLDELDITPTSMIDISDGLASEVIHLTRASGLGAAIYEEKIPLHENTISCAQQFDLQPTTCALNGGEDYELLFTILQSDFDKLRAHPELTVIGHMAEKSVGNQLISNDGQQITLKAQGWDAMLSNDSA
ncbi:MAG: thiamine-phosphate kinase [Flavobacteriales bacterium]|nr:thiamine-phosphate kinase [Flavobacteriales bacterium]